MEKMICFKNVTKRFPGNTALDNVSFSVYKAEIHALLGENGAGKSTLLNILHGIYNQYEGEIEVDNTKIDFKNANSAIEFGISKVHQEVSLVQELTVGQNIALGYEPQKGIFTDYRAMYDKTDILLKRLGCRFKSTDRLRGLSVGEMQMIQIAKALFHNAKVISFDEPTSALTEKETQRLLEIIKELKEQGITILYVTHRLDEVFRLADSATVLRDGKYIGTMKVQDITREELIRNMVGRDVSAFAVRKEESPISTEILLEVEGLERHGIFKDISFQLHRGEILSFAGLVGAKRTEVMRTIFGADKKTGGVIRLHGEIVHISSPESALSAGIALIPEDRKMQGFVKSFTNALNIALASIPNFTKLGFVDFTEIKNNCCHYAEEVDLHPTDPEYLTENLSGGNAQKVIIAKWLTANPEIIIFDEPTKGIDVGAKAEIYRLMEQLVKKGKGILMVSSELPEVIGMSDRVIVMKEGRIVGRLEKEELTEEKILHLAMEGSEK